MSLVESAGTINQDIMGGTMLIVGLFITFFGARFFKYIVFFVGFIIGAFITYYSVPVIWSWFKADVADDTLLYMSLTVGVLCGVLLMVIYKAAVFSCGAICGATLSQMLWIAVVSNVDTEGKKWMSGVQVGVLLAFALVGGWLASKFVEQVLKAITAFVGGFMFASGIAYFISRIDKSDQRNVIDWVIFFGSYNNYSNLEDVCDAYCIVCILLWLIMFAAGCFVQYKLHKKHKKKDHGGGDSSSEEDSDSDDSDDDDDSDKHRKVRKKRRDSDEDSSSDDSSSAESRRSKKKRKKKKKQTPVNEYNDYNEPPGSEYGGYAGSYHGSQYGAGASSMRQNNRYGMSIHSQSAHEGTGGGPGSVRSNPQIAMSEYGARYNNRGSAARQPAPGVARSEQYGDYGQRHVVQYV